MIVYLSLAGEILQLVLCTGAKLFSLDSNHEISQFYVRYGTWLDSFLILLHIVSFFTYLHFYSGGQCRPLSDVYTSNLLNDLEFYLGQILSLYEAKSLGKYLAQIFSFIKG